DIMLMQKIVASWNIDKSTYNEEAADVNADGNIDLEDLILLQKKVAGWNVTFGK
nr:hypothetical protein [Ruminococcus sp.]